MAEASFGRAFINYSRADGQQVVALGRILEELGLEVWTDRDLRGGQEWWKVIVENIQSCRVFVYALSPVSVESPMCLAELEWATTVNRTLLPVIVQPVSGHLIPRELAEFQWIDFTKADADAVARLARALEALPRLPPLPDPLPPPPAVPLAPREPEPSRSPASTLDPANYSRNVNLVRETLPGSVTASALAAALQTHNPDYADGKIGSVVFPVGEGPTAAADTWLTRVSGLYDPAALARSRHRVISGRLVLAGLAELEPLVADALAVAGVAELLWAEVEVHPRSKREDEPHREIGDVGFAADLVGDGRMVRESDDRLGIEDDVRTLCRLIMARSTVPPLAVGLFGDWGTGKSFFLQRMRTRIDEMMAEAEQSAIGLGSCEHVVQVTFNAWHYLDADLWASLAVRLYQGVANSRVTNEEFRRRMFERLVSTRAVSDKASRDRERATRELDRAERELKEREATLERLDNGELTVGDAASAVGLVMNSKPELAMAEGTAVGELAKDLRFGREVVRRVIGQTSTTAKVLAVAAFVLVVAGVALVSRVGWPGSLVALVPGAVAAATAWVKGFRGALRQVRTQAAQAQQLAIDADRRLRAAVVELRAEVDSARATQEAADATLNEIHEGGFVRRYLSERVQMAAYRDRLGLISLVREDLETLTEMLGPASTEVGRARIDRIVLYVDDLDRCPPARVVEVLQAVHLLLAFPLFVVVVAVDSRWLITSLELHYRELLKQDGAVDGSVSFADWELTPANYLEKIFQIPLVLRPMTADGYARLVGELAPVRRTDGASTEPRQPEPTGAAGARPTTAGATDATGRPAGSAATAVEAVEAVEPPILLRASTQGDVLGTRFSADGQRLFLATTEGVWRWERGGPDLVRDVDTTVVLAAISPDGQTVALVDAERVLHLVDPRSGPPRAHEIPQDVDLVELAVGGVSDRTVVVGVTAAGQVTSLVGELELADAVQNAPARHVSLTADGAVALWLEGDEMMLISGRERSAWLGKSVDYVLSADDEKLSVHDGLGRTKRSEWLVREEMTAPTTIDAFYRRAQDPTGVDLARAAARTSEGWWLRAGDGRLWCWVDGEELPIELAFTVSGDRLAAEVAGPLVVTWGGGGFEVVDRVGVRYRVLADANGELVVDHASVSPLGRLVATVGAGEVRLWQVSSTDRPELPSQLALEPEEAEFLVALAPLVGTPRMAKRLVNVYRLLRASEVGRTRLADPSTGDYRAAMLLLALVVAQPEVADRVLQTLDTTDEPDWSRIVKTVDHDVLKQLSLDPTPTSLLLYREWAEHVRRFYVAPR